MLLREPPSLFMSASSPSCQNTVSCHGIPQKASSSRSRLQLALMKKFEGVIYPDYNAVDSVFGPSICKLRQKAVLGRCKHSTKEKETELMIAVIVLDSLDDPMVTESLHAVVASSVRGEEISVLGRAATRGDSGAFPGRHPY
jgi:hypothetical protein